MVELALAVVVVAVEVEIGAEVVEVVELGGYSA